MYKSFIKANIPNASVSPSSFSWYTRCRKAPCGCFSSFLSTPASPMRKHRPTQSVSAGSGSRQASNLSTMYMPGYLICYHRRIPAPEGGLPRACREVWGSVQYCQESPLGTIHLAPWVDHPRSKILPEEWHLLLAGASLQSRTAEFLLDHTNVQL